MKIGSIIRFSENGVDGIMPVIKEDDKFFYCSHGEQLPKRTWRLATDEELIKARRSLAERSQAKAIHKIFHPKTEEKEMKLTLSQIQQAIKKCDIIIKETE